MSLKLNIPGIKIKQTLLGAAIACMPLAVQAQQHPGILMTPGSVAAIRKGCTDYALLQKSFAAVKSSADKAIKEGVQVPAPKDAGGGYTHELHKKNYQSMLACGMAWQVTGDKKYAAFVQQMLEEYARQYESWPLHPARKSHQHAGKIFWQNLNDCVWGVYTAMAYDLVYDAIPAAARNQIETHLLRPELEFLTKDNKETFDWIHNHGTWCVTAVGLTGYVLNDRNYTEMALKGSDKSGKGGYLAQLQQLFSPDGYYTEGPYYQRYAMLPFVLMAKAIDHYQPELKIFSYNNGTLIKAIDATLQSSYTNGAFFPVNDAMKDKTILSEEIIYAADIAYGISHDPGLLDIAQKQKRVIVSDAGLQVAADLAAGKSKPFEYHPMVLRDGAAGQDGGLGILRAGNNKDQQCVLLKAAGHGMGHGHFDQLNMLYYDHGTEIFSDYGAARFLNIVTKSGGDYLPENKTWAKQTIAHNTLVLDQVSQFNAKADDAQQYHANILHFEQNGDMQVVSAEDTNAYKGARLLRTVALVPVKGISRPLLISICNVQSSGFHSFDLPFWYQGQLTDVATPLRMKTDSLRAIGSDNGYQHLWLQAEQPVAAANGAFTLFTNNRFYTTTFTADSATKEALVMTGANDPANNLRSEKAFMIRQPFSNSKSVVSVTEAHGGFDPSTEAVSQAAGNISQVAIVEEDEDHLVFRFDAKGHTYNITLRYKDQQHFFEIQTKQ